jgi:hypothetical protein
MVRFDFKSENLKNNPNRLCSNFHSLLSTIVFVKVPEWPIAVSYCVHDDHHYLAQSTRLLSSCRLTGAFSSSFPTCSLAWWKRAIGKQ